MMGRFFAKSQEFRPVLRRARREKIKKGLQGAAESARLSPQPSPVAELPIVSTPMNTLLDLMHQVWHRRTPARPSVLRAAAVPSRRAVAAAGKAPAAPASDLWAWYQSRCTAEEAPAVKQ